MSEADAPEAFRRKRAGGPSFLVFVGILAMLFIVAPALDFAMAPDYQREASVIRGRLAQAESKTTFRDVVEQAGLMCRESGDQLLVKVTCRRTDGLHAWNWMSWLQRFPDAVVARGEFIDGRKSAEYQVTVERLDPKSI